MANAVIVVDMQNGFMTPEGALYCGDNAREIIPHVVARVKAEKAAGSTIFFTQDSHVVNDREFAMFPPHCVAGTVEEQIIDELQPLTADARIIKKRTLSLFYGTNLAEQLATLQPEKVVVMGDCTDICVLYGAFDLRMRDYQVEVPADAVASFDEQQHTWALGHMQKVLGVQVT